MIKNFLMNGFLILLTTGVFGAINVPVNLRCEGLVDPLHIETSTPRLSWLLVNDFSGMDHVSWQVQAASSREGLLSGKPDLWNSRWQPYKEGWHSYQGKNLESYEPCYWRVRTRTKDRQVSDWSEPAMFRMGVLSPEDWRGKWIGHIEPLPGYKPGPTARELDLREVRWIWVEEQPGDYTREVYCTQGPKGIRYIFSKSFEAPASGLEWAVLRLAIDGSANEVYLNGEMIKLVNTGGHGLADSWSMPVEIDLMEHLVKGENNLDISILQRQGAVVRNGFQAVVVWKDKKGVVSRIPTDMTWKAVHEPSGEGRKISPKPYLIPMRSKRLGYPSWGQENVTPMMRRDFSVDNQIVSAIASVCGLGYYELSLNGQRVGDRMIDPAFTNYDKRVLYSTYDLTGQLKSGNNTLGLVLGNGYYNHVNKTLFLYDIAEWRDEPKAILQLRIEYADGRVEWVLTDEKWKAARSPVVLNGVFNGQVYDARLEQDGWNNPGFNDTNWRPVVIMTPPKGKLASTNMPPERVIELLEAEEITETLHHSFIYKFPRITTGQPRLRVSGPAGTRVVMRSYEVPDDRHDTHVNLQGPFQTDTYILKGEGEEYFEPGFTYHGFQYIELTGYPGEPDKESLKVAVIHTDLERAGTFSCSSELINGIQANTCNSYLTNYHGLPLDCPTREKGGWTADGYLAAETGLFNFDAFNAHSKWIDDMMDCQHEDGRIPDIAPTALWGYNGHFDWDCGIIFMPWYNYLYTGNTEILERSYGSMKACYEHYYKLADNGILMNGRGDHGLNKTPTYRPVTITALLSECATILSKIAGLLDNEKDQTDYQEKAAFVKDAFVREFLEADGTIANGSMTAQSCALYYDFVPANMRDKVVDKLVEAVHKSDAHVDFGIFGAKYVFTVLSENGHHDLAYKIATQETYPGYGWCVKQGMTALVQYWDLVGTYNHIMFGDISAWFYRNLAGIKAMEKAPGFKEFVLEPRVNIDLDHVNASHESPYGTIRSSWKKEGNEVEYHFEVPVNTKAHIILEGEPLEGPAMTRTEADKHTVSLGSGMYVFRMKQ